jgi:DNA primase large subunit
MAVHRAPSGIDERTLFAAYPFLPGAAALAAGLGASVGELLRDPAFERCRLVGRARIRAAAGDPRGATAIEELDHAAEAERFLSFLFARYVLSTFAHPAARRRWAVAESKRASGRLEHAGAPEIAEVGRRLGFGYETVGREIEMPLDAYLHLATPIREAEFRLARQRLRRGTVRVDPARGARLLEEGIRRTLAEPVRLDTAIVEAIRTSEAELERELRERIPLPSAAPAAGRGPIRMDWFPPCLRKMRRTLEAGENLSHAGRFALAAFLHRVGADRETIVDAFRGAPDFDESITRYQVEHITQHGGGEGYRPPECATLRSHGLCVRDGDPTAAAPEDRQRDDRCFDERLQHPLQYYRNRGGRERPTEPAPTEPGEGSGTSGRPG